MKTITATDARSTLFKLIDSVSNSHTPLKIAGKRNSVVVIGEDDWRSLEETIYISSVPGLKNEIIEGSKVPLENCFDEKDLDW